MIKVLGRRNSNNVIPVMWTIGELGIEHERVNIGGSFKGNDTAEYLALNPNGLIPTLIDDDFVIYESLVIVRYLSDQYGRGTLSPDDIQQRAHADQWMEWYRTTLMPHHSMIFFSVVRKPPEEQDWTMINAQKALLEKGLSILDKQLADKTFVTGDAFTMADIPLGVLAYRYYAINIEQGSFPNIEQWLDRLRTRPAFKQHVDFPFGSNPKEFLALEQAG